MKTAIGIPVEIKLKQVRYHTYFLTNNLFPFFKGPPGCGKTFIGVKIVQLLLSLTPKLDKPILLMTYKNHALDEFLKQTLKFCKKNDLVRIGGRSIEPELESCKLNKIQIHIPYDKETSAEIADKRSEMENIESKICNISKKVEASSYLTKRSLVDDLSEEQIQSLITEADWGSRTMVYEVGRRYNADKKWMKRLLDDVSEQHGSVKKFLQMALELESPSEQSKLCDFDCIAIFNRVFQEWFPGRGELKKLKAFQAEFVLPIQISKPTDTSEKSHNDDDNDDSGDEDYVEQLLERRMEAGTRQTLRNDFMTFDTKTKNRFEVLVHLSDYPPDMVASLQICSVSNLWSLGEVERLKFLYCILNKKTTSVSQELNDLIKQVQSLKKRKEELELTDKVKFLSKKKIIGVTITGASINHDLLHHIGPSVVIVEEAAEILEPSLLAALTPSIEHLILIGDHRQLRPQLDTYELCKKYKFDVSMMERLIESRFPYESLAKQNRMRPEFSALLHDIYPSLEDNLPLVSTNAPLKCIAKSMFFWSHEDPEKRDRTYSNLKEAERVIALVRYLLCNGVSPSDITVLAAYLGQTKLLRNMMRREKEKMPKFFQKNDEQKFEQGGFVQVQTIDTYQGDENKYIIISLVRSNEENKIGFLKSMNRRCVAQSRAKCGMYFLGNPKTLCGAENSCWLELISSMTKEDCVSNKFPLQCIKHKTSTYKVVNSNDIQKVINNPALLCKLPCGDTYMHPYCGEHPCRKPCHPKHDHMDCPEMVDDHFPICGHYVKRRCSKSLSSLLCMSEESVDLPCGHRHNKKCHQNISDIVCRVLVTTILQKCKHKVEKPCYRKVELICCKQECKKMNSCGIHHCKMICGKSHGHETCSAMIDYKFPECDHPSPKKKKCSEAITWKCTYKVSFTGACDHEIQKECHQSENEVKCGFKPCIRVRKCGHPCPNTCGEDCEKGECKHCLRVYRKKMKEFREAARKRVKELEEKIEKKEIPSFSRDELRSTGSTAAEYQKVKDQVLKFIQPCHNWFPTITKIERVTNLELEKKFEGAKSRAFGDYIDTKFHGTSGKSLKEIIKKGFKMPETNPRPPKKRGMFGQGIYFATDSSKSARSIYTQGSQKLLLCQVILGKSMTVEKADNTLNKNKLGSKSCDSVYAPRGTAVINDEFVIFDPDQALPQYIIHFSDSKKLVPPSPSVHSQQSFTVKNMKASRLVNFQDPFEMFYNFAECHFRRMAATGKPPLSPQQATISSIDIVINKDLEDKFEATKKTFNSQGIPDKEILAYHGTDKKNIDSILKDNLQLSYAKRQAHGKGNYFSEYPSVSLDYGDGLLLCRILPGKEFVDPSASDIPAGYNSKKVLLGGQSASGSTAATGATANVSGKMIIIENSDQILPFFVIHR